MDSENKNSFYMGDWDPVRAEYEMKDAERKAEKAREEKKASVKKERKKFRFRLPLTAVLFVTAAAAAAAGAFGRNTIYAGNAAGFNPVTTPYVSLVMSGIHDRVYPWVMLIGQGAEKDEVDEAIAALLADAERSESTAVKTETPKPARKSLKRQEAAAGSAEEAEEAAEPETAAAVESGGNAAAPSAEEGAANTEAESAGEPEEGAEENSEDAAGAETESTGKSADENAEEASEESAEENSEDTADEPAEENAGEDSGETAEENTEEHSAEGEDVGAEEDYPSEAARLAAEQENDTYIWAETMPEGVCSPVVQAVDYGVADGRYLAPAGTVWNEDTGGPFGQNGDYYRLRQVDDYYFTDAIFIGDSRTVGLYEYGGFGEMSTFMARESLSVYSMWKTSMTCHNYGGPDEYTTLLDQLQKVRYAKIYLSLGINELGFPTSKEFYQKYREAVAVIRQLQPDAIIYIQGIMHVSKSRSSSDGIFNNKIIVERNTAIASLANGHDIFYIDMNGDICDEEGNLPADITFDGVHLLARGYTLWHDFLTRNAIVRDVGKDYRGAGPEAAAQQ